ncbi:regulator of G-protein signaling protein-like [Perognathus longimembris pacificus]|uniref:regulator of G-protein signaling protein-like n=1 Tax=Perognathus longimembris pacificus TaxID=214514 RepID=UPI002019408E|nr:regulator of G-protein signaling protein-like [Perognathus longimembris pacificus]
MVDGAGCALGDEAWPGKEVTAIGLPGVATRTPTLRQYACIFALAAFTVRSYIISSTNLIILLEDEIFADFFNTFLSLPVFGQTPFYTVESSQWSLWPEMPYDLMCKYKKLLTWLEKYRLPFFCKTNLCFHYILCQELISFIKSQEGAKMMRWQKADQWLLEKCIGGVRGMLRFFSYLKDSAGEELVDFWILAEKILSIDETNVDVQDYYLSLLLALKATHLQEGSRVVTLCNVNIKSLLNLSIWHPNQSTTRREILSHMQKVALFKLQSYWLPNFYNHGKMTMASEEACCDLLQEYESRRFSVYTIGAGGIPLNMSVKKSQRPPKRYSSRRVKRKMWYLINPGSWSMEMVPKPDVCPISSQELSDDGKMTMHMPPLKVDSARERLICLLEKDRHCVMKSTVKKKPESLHMEGLFETKFSSHLRTSTPIFIHSSQMTINKVIKQRLSFRYTYWALRADAYAGSPFRDFLKKLNLKVETKLLDLWQDLHHFLSVLMSNRKNGNSVFRHMLSDRICEIYLNEQNGPCLPLTPQTTLGLKKMLPSGDANPWISKAQMEICKTLNHWYDEFLDEEDYWFLLVTSQNRYVRAQWHKESPSREDSIFLYKRLQESLELSQSLTNMEKMDSPPWQTVATENLRKSGSLQVEVKSPVFLEDFNKMNFKELCYKNPKMAIEMISEDYKIYCEKVPQIEIEVKIVKEPKVMSSSYRKLSVAKKGGVRKPSVRPRNFTDILLNQQHLDFFRDFLKDRKAEAPLQFLIAVQKITSETNEKAYKAALDNLTRTFFHSNVPAEELLQCNAPIVKEIMQMQNITTTTLLMLQTYVMKSLEERWFIEYQQLFPVRAIPDLEPAIPTFPRKPSKTALNLQKSQKKGWIKMVNFIKSFCKYRRCMANPQQLQGFLDYLHKELYNTKENFTTSPTASGRPTPMSPSSENGEGTFVKRRIYGHRIIIVNFATNDLYFFSEMERFNELVSSAHMLLINKAYNENDLILMRSKLNIILKLFLNSDIPPKLRVNLSESQKDVIVAAITEGHMDRTIFHGAILTIFPVIMYFWKRFCSWKAACSYFHYVGKVSKERKTLPRTTYKSPVWNVGDHSHAVLRFSLNRGLEWLRPQHQQRDVLSPIQNSSSSNLTQLKAASSNVQLNPAQGIEHSSMQILVAHTYESSEGVDWIVKGAANAGEKIGCEVYTDLSLENH